MRGEEGGTANGKSYPTAEGGTIDGGQIGLSEGVGSETIRRKINGHSLLARGGTEEKNRGVPFPGSPPGV